MFRHMAVILRTAQLLAETTRLLPARCLESAVVRARNLCFPCVTVRRSLNADFFVSLARPTVFQPLRVRIWMVTRPRRLGATLPRKSSAPPLWVILSVTRYATPTEKVGDIAPP